MVAYAGPGWTLAPSLVALFEEAKRRYPNRSTASDGSIGDAGHASGTSDHNPNAEGWVTAGDMTDDPADGFDASDWAEGLRQRRDPRVKYAISDDRIFASYATASRPAWTWGPYSGSNPHTKHAHVSVLDTQTGLHDTRSWFGPEEEEDMTPEQAATLDEVASDVQVLRDHEKAHYDAVQSHITKVEERLSAVEKAVDPDADLQRKGSGARKGVQDVVRNVLNDDFHLNERLAGIEAALGIAPQTATPRDGS